MSNINIDINHENINILIQKIQTNLDDISRILKKNKNIISELDNSWIGPDKKKFDSEYFPYIEIISNLFINNMNNCLSLLKKANINYQDINSEMKEESLKLQS